MLPEPIFETFGPGPNDVPPPEPPFPALVLSAFPGSETPPKPPPADEIVEKVEVDP